MFGFTQQKTITDEVKIDELLSRGIENVFPNKEFVKAKMMRGERVTLYLGVDPTGPTLHMGHVIPLLKMAKFQELGHQIILLMGDFTAMIGDPTDKTSARKKLSSEEVMANLKEYKNQASKYISFSGSNKALFKFNSEWLGEMGFADVLDLASNMTVGQMMERDMFENRSKEGKPIYIHEFMYPLMQGYDSVAMNVDGEIGGNDQTFNMLVGRDLLKTLKNKEKFVIACKLLVDPTGKKMGKTENNMVSLDQTPEDMFGKIMSWGDELIIPALELITTIPSSQINKIKNSILVGGNPKEFKLVLAREIVATYHGEGEAKKAEEAFENTFSKGGVPENIEEISIEGSGLVEELIKKEIVSSKTEWRRLLQDGAVTSVENGEKIKDESFIKEGVYRIGKKRFIKIK
ncbi:MAG: tyrosine--tRNA ligase [Patescibacteria group bacterium]